MIANTKILKMLKCLFSHSRKNAIDVIGAGDAESENTLEEKIQYKVQ